MTNIHNYFFSGRECRFNHNIYENLLMPCWFSLTWSTIMTKHWLYLTNKWYQRLGYPISIANALEILYVFLLLFFWRDLEFTHSTANGENTPVLAIRTKYDFGHLYVKIGLYQKLVTYSIWTFPNLPTQFSHWDITNGWHIRYTRSRRYFREKYVLNR